MEEFMKPIFKVGLIGAIIISFVFGALPFVEPVEAQVGKDIIQKIRRPRFRPSGYGQQNMVEEQLSKLITKHEEVSSSKTRKKKPTSAIESNALTPFSKNSNPALSNNNYAWMLSPKVFNKLSSAGKKAALYRNGLLDTSTITKTNTRVASKIETQLNVLGSNVRVNDPTSDLVLRTQSETSIAVRGNNVIASFNDISVDRNTCGYSFSTDGGNTFVQKSIPEPADQFNLGDGVVAYGPNGELYYALLALKGSNSTSILTLRRSQKIR
jgi:hypothetical protein